MTEKLEGQTFVQRQFAYDISFAAFLIVGPVILIGLNCLW